jgi:tRNA nucleotidyltransferase/poly(A) polymerase
LDEDDPLEDAVAPAWGGSPFTTPEEITLHLAEQNELRNILKHCIMVLGAAPHQLQAIIQELREYGALELLQSVLDELNIDLNSTQNENPHMSQHKDHAHKKIRHCLQQQSTNLTVRVALRLTECKQRSTAANGYTIDLQSLTSDDLLLSDIHIGLHELVAEGLLDWHGEDIVYLTTAQAKRLARFYKEE